MPTVTRNEIVGINPHVRGDADDADDQTRVLS